MNFKLLNFNSIQVILLFFVVLMASFSSCKKDPNKKTYQLNYDSGNLTAPNFPANTYEGAARFPASRMAEYSGGNLVEVEYYIKDVPNSTRLKVYTGTSSSAPVTEVYSATLTGSVNAEDWNTHTLTDPLLLDGSDLWLSIEFTHSDTRQVLGCDTGPAATDGDHFYDPATGYWQKLNQFNSGIDINWNIRGKVEVDEE